ncbi:membrane protein insertase YidC [Chenggangzhangella methanolivorans]|uniref:Membrane protein insertase YidC n=1 Tax=Chenggangzhangella methanolivorans TaxID=1437009 RepID=A0A9E6UJL6_9HYPH|nr:membrane protein insertase YidC [Chenggangzhangella methanolivorans]QZN98246.1 membrane protein insertase YidC [Chenggangzhangella methanolivorans]
MDNRNTLIAIVLSVLVLVGWQYFVAKPQLDAQREQQAAQQALTDENKATPAPGVGPQAAPAAGAQSPAGAPAAQPGAAGGQIKTREQALAGAPRVKIDSNRLDGSISLIGGRVDDVQLKDYRETVDPKSPEIVLFAPIGSPQPYYAEFGYVNGAGENVKLPDGQTEWKAETTGPLTTEKPVVLVWDNGQGLVFRRTISIDGDYLFTVKDNVQNTGAAATTLHPYALLSRHGEPQTLGYWFLHEGPIGVFGQEGLSYPTYKDITGGPRTYKATGGWLGFTDKYWGAALIPPQDKGYAARFASATEGGKLYQSDYLLDPIVVAPGATSESTARLFAGAKQVAVIDKYESQGVLKFELMIDWGTYLHLVTKPMFYALDFFYKLVGNFGIAILIVTLCVKIIFFPLANKSYVSMSKMKLVQPEMVKIKERFPDDKQRQQQELMELYKREKINPLAGCLPILIQIPVFFALYKVLFIAIEMRHAPFYGWIHDLAAPDPTSLFNLFGLLPYDVPHFLLIGVWPILMGISMFVQMRLNPAPPDPTQAMIFNWMPLFFTFLLASFPAGLVIYWTWNNLLSILQQWIIMKRQGVEVNIIGNTLDVFRKKKPADAAKS